MEPGNDLELKRVLREWHAPEAPDALEHRVFGRAKPSWRRLMSARVRIPLPIAVAFAVTLLWLAVLVIRDRGPAREPLVNPYDLRGFQPVNSVNVRIERSGDATQ
jgi:hypothetical protein